MKSTLRIATATLLLPLIAGVLISLPSRNANAAGATLPKYLPPQVSRDRDNRNDGERDKRDRDQAIREQASRDQAIRDQAIRDQRDRDQRDRDQRDRDQRDRDQRDRDQRDRYNRPDDNRNTDWRNGNNGRDNDHRHDNDWRDNNGCRRDCRHSSSECRIYVDWRDSNGCKRDCRHSSSGCRVYDNWRDSNGCRRDCRHNVSGCRVYDNWRDSNGCRRDCRHNTSDCRVYNNWRDSNGCKRDCHHNGGDCRRAPVVIIQGGGYGHDNGNHNGWYKSEPVVIDVKATVICVDSSYQMKVQGGDGRHFQVTSDHSIPRDICPGDRIRICGTQTGSYTIRAYEVSLISCQRSTISHYGNDVNFPGYIESVHCDRNMNTLRVRGDNGVCYSVSISGGSYRNGDRVRVIGSYSNGIIGATYCGR